MGEDITVVNALFKIVQRIEDKVDVLKDDMSSIKTKQAIIETSLNDHVDAGKNENAPKKGILDSTFSFIRSWILPIVIAIFLLGRQSVEVTHPVMKQYPPSSIISSQVDDTQVIKKNRKIDSILISKMLRGS